MQCVHCGNEFEVKPWPSTKHIYCSPNCRRNAWKKKNPDYVWKNIEKSRETKRRWNWSEKGKTNRKVWYKKHRKEVLDRLRTPEQKVLARSRNKARRLLEKEGIIVCVICNTNVRVEVHHKDFDPLNNSIDNLEGRCKLHHTDAHHIHNLHVDLVKAEG